MRTSIVLLRGLGCISENIARLVKSVGPYLREDQDRIVGWGMLLVACACQASFGIFW